MRRLAIVTVALVVVLFVASQLAIPPIESDRIASRLTVHGGSAHVELSAFPALRLLGGDGDSVRVRARGLTFALAPPASSLRRLDGFHDVDLALTDSQSGPFRLASASLTRKGGQPYRLTLDATVTGADLASYAGGQFGGELGSALGGLAGQVLPFAQQPIPVTVDTRLRSVGGRPAVVSAGGTIAGIPADPIIEAVADALAARV